MPLVRIQLPLIQKWDCHGCASCCRDYRVHLDDEEHARIASQDWATDPELAGLSLIGRDRQGYHLGQRADGSCVFLSAQGRCRIHERYGSAAKPFACRLYPFVLIPGGEHWSVGLRFSCPSVVRNEGKPLDAHVGELSELQAELAKREPRSSLPPTLGAGQAVGWPDFNRFIGAILFILKNADEPLERRWRKVLALRTLCQQARFEKVHGMRLGEFLEVIRSGLDAEVPADPADVPPPSWVGRILFRQALAVYLRKDVGPERGPAARNRWALLGAAWRFARGRGDVPRLHTLLPETTFEHAEQPAGPLPEAMQGLLERYYLAKVASMQFCGPVNFGKSFWEGLEELALTCAVHLWLRRALSELAAEEAAVRAVRIVDHNFGYSPHLGTRRQRISLGILAGRGELEKLIAWYSR